MAISDMIVSVLPERYRRDIVLLVLGGAVAMLVFHLEVRIDTAYAAAQQDPPKIADLSDRIKLVEGQTSTIQSNTLATKQEVDLLFQAALNDRPLPTAPSVPARQDKN